MKIDHLKAELDLEKEKFNEAKSRIEDLRLEIARVICPIGIGERVRYQKMGKSTRVL